jgi:CheY-like chemotaxis protein
MSCRLLIVEDSEADVFLIREALTAAGVRFESEVASTGEKALALIDRLELNAGGRKFDLMILDLNLTTHSGIEVLRRVRGAASMAELQVVILTSSDSPEDRRIAEALGTDAYLRKPLDLDQFMQIGRQIAGFLKAA